MRKRDVPVTDQELKLIFKEVDVDNGGSINYAEFKQVPIAIAIATATSQLSTALYNCALIMLVGCRPSTSSSASTARRFEYD